MLYPYIYNQYYKFIRKNCNPLVKKYKIMLDDVSLQKSKARDNMLFHSMHITGCDYYSTELKHCYLYLLLYSRCPKLGVQK